ncbi:MAG: FeoB-associated Cys-rich membrane protein [Clostridia bacterium]|nr:FeoB-associated Cys-rich membrane protein [Clostridia bacterium]
MENYIIIAVVAIIVVLAALYIYKAKKSGKKCIGCPYADSCQVNCSGCNGYCSSAEDE